MTHHVCRILCLSACALIWSVSPADGRATARQAQHEMYSLDIRGMERPEYPDEIRMFRDVTYPNFVYPGVGDIISPIKRPFDAVVLENELLLLVQLPSLGGQTFVFRDKRTGKDILMSPSRPNITTNFALQKGAHVSFPVAEHGQNALEPWACSIWVDAAGAHSLFTHRDEVTGFRIRVHTQLPHRGYQLDLRAEMTNPGSTTQVGAMWSLHQFNHGDNLRLFLPTRAVNVHTGFDLPSAYGSIHQALARNDPMPYPRVLGLDLTLASNWPDMKGVYAMGIEKDWCAAHHTDQKRGVAKLFLSGVHGLKNYNDRRLTELFTGITRNFTQYSPFAPGETRVLHEKVIPTVGLTWVSDVSRHGVLGLWSRAEDGVLVAEYLPVDSAAQPMELALLQDGKVLGASRGAGRSGEVIRVEASPKGARKPARFYRLQVRPQAVAVGRAAKHSQRPIWEVRIPADSVAVLNRTAYREPPLDSILAGQASAFVPPDTTEIQTQFRQVPDSLRVKAFHRRAFQVEASVTSDDPESEKLKLPLPQIHNGISVQVRKATTYVLTRNGVMIFTDTLWSADSSRFGYDFGAPAQPSDAQTDLSQRHRVQQVKLPASRWQGGMRLVGDRLVLGLDKRLEIRDSVGGLLDTVGLNDWPAGMSSDGQGGVLVCLPYAGELFRLDPATGVSRRIPLKASGFAHPWAVTPIPTGYAVSSGTSRNILLLGHDFAPSRVVRAWTSDSLRQRFRAIPALVWNAESGTLLASDLDNMRIVHVDTTSGLAGSFTRGGFGRGNTLMVRDLTTDGQGYIIALQHYSRRHNASEIQAFTGTGAFRGVLGERFRPRQAYAGGESGSIPAGVRLASPLGADSLLFYDFLRRALAVADSTGHILQAVSADAWGRGFHAFANDVWHDPVHGVFIADGEKGVVLHFDSKLAFVDEILSPGSPFEFHPTAVVTDARGNLHAVSSNDNTIHLFERREDRKTGAVRYRFKKRYGAPRKVLRDGPFQMQRLYRQNKFVVAGDATRGLLLRFSPSGRFRDKVRLWPAPSYDSLGADRFVASPRGALAPGGVLVIPDLSEPRVALVDAKGTVRIQDAWGLLPNIKSLHHISTVEGWRRNSRPAGAVWVQVLSHLRHVWLDSTFSPISGGAVPQLHTRSLESFAPVPGGFALSVRDHRGIALADTSSGLVRWVDVEGLKSHPSLLKRVPSSLTLDGDSVVLAAVMRESGDYAEFTSDGRLLRAFRHPSLNGIYNFSFTRSGDLLAPDDKRKAAVAIDRRSGKEVRLWGLRNPVMRGNFLETVEEGPDGRIFAQDWQHGNIVAVDSAGALDVIFAGSVAGWDGGFNNSPWFHFWGENKIIFSHGRGGRIHVIELGGRHLGMFPEESQRSAWNWQLWSGVDAGPGKLFFRGGDGIQEVRFEEPR